MSISSLIKLMALPALAVMAQLARAEATSPSEYQVKAAFIYNFAKYAEWPSEVMGGRDRPFTLCIVGRDPSDSAFSSVEGRQVGGRPLKIRRDVRMEDIAGCHIAFISESEEHRLPSVLKSMASAPILTISDIDGFVEAGGAVGMFVAEDRLKFDANFTALQRANIKVNSQVLWMARTVHGVKR